MKQLYNTEEALERVSELISSSERILFITGAGISADSGLPTYRGIGGLYNDGLTEEGISIEEALSGSMMRERPDVTWKYLWKIGSACHKAVPSKAHEVISLIQNMKPDTWVLTQNIDGLHIAANTTNMIEIHGNIFSLHCIECGRKKNYDELILEFQDKLVFPPICSLCGGIIRPDVVLFGEQLPSEAMTKFYDIIDNQIDLVISIGTSGLFSYIVEPVNIANNRCKPTVEINPDITDISYLFKYRIEMKAAEAMGKILERLALS